MIRVSQPTFLGREKQYIDDVVAKNFFSMGEYVQKFESLIARSMAATHAIATTSGTTALHAALLALGVRPGDRVIVPACSYIATSNAVLYCGAEPVFVDVDEQNWLMDPDAAQQAFVRHKAVGIITVHLYGAQSPTPAINGWVVEDACEAHGLPLSRGAAAAILSFYGNKIVTCGEGGAVVTNSPILHERITSIRGQGMHKTKRYIHEEIGYNYRMTDIQAAIGCGQMEMLDKHLEERVRLRMAYEEWLPAKVKKPRRLTRSVDWVMPVLVAERDRVSEALAIEGIETRPVFPPLHLQPVNRRATIPSLPVSEMLGRNGLLLPLHLGMTRDDVKKVCAVLAAAIK